MFIKICVFFVLFLPSSRWAARVSFNENGEKDSRIGTIPGYISEFIGDGLHPQQQPEI